MDRKGLSAVGVVLVPFLVNVLANVFYDVLKANVGAIADGVRSPWFPSAVFAVLAFLWLFYWVARPAWRQRKANARPHVKADAGVGEVTAKANDPAPDLSISGDVEAQVIPGPGSPSLNQVSYASRGRRHYAYDKFGRRPNAVRFSKPEDRIIRAADLPAVMPCGRGRLVVEKFFARGVVIDEDGTTGDPVAFVGYFDD